MPITAAPVVARSFEIAPSPRLASGGTCAICSQRWAVLVDTPVTVVTTSCFLRKQGFGEHNLFSEKQAFPEIARIHARPQSATKEEQAAAWAARFRESTEIIVRRIDLSYTLADAVVNYFELQADVSECELDELRTWRRRWAKVRIEARDDYPRIAA